ncbi:MAG: crossover junction endodeoxyribonuclease RuvC [Parcubacteria group bacterium]|nr:crossover junction endodeoxyribonuclease RuvC [Parcubacteria group bacterium]
MIILGIDPGSTLIGYGAVKSENRKLVCLDYGTIKIKSKETHLRLLETRKSLKKILAGLKPDKAVLEKLFFFKNRRTAIDVSQARGVILLTLAENKIPVTEVAPLELKNALTGFGRASKGSIQKMVKLVLNLKEEPKPDDAADALALAILEAGT